MKNWNFRYFFEKEISNPNLLILPEGMVVADIGAGNGWSSSLLALRPEISKVYDRWIFRMEYGTDPETVRRYKMIDAKKARLKRKDIILAYDGTRINSINPTI